MLSRFVALSVSLTRRVSLLQAKWLKPSDAAKVEALGIKDHALMDMHVGGGGGIGLALGVFDTYRNYSMGAVNAETNAGDHSMGRALSEASDLNDWLNCAAEDCKRIHFRTASFCQQRIGEMTGDPWDQGISSFLPNMTWLQPCAKAHPLEPSVLF